MTLLHDNSIRIIGGGTWSCGIALELARNEYNNVTVLDGEEVPSSIAAGNDLNKIMEEGSQSEDDTDAAYAWNRYVMAASSDPAYAALLEDIKGHEDEYENVNSAEADLYKNLPVLFHIEKGFFMEPSAETHELKICDEHPGYINPIYSRITEDDGTAVEEKSRIIIGSRPFARYQIPLEAEARMRSFLREMMPHLATRPFCFARICWDTDTSDWMPLVDWYLNLCSERRNFLLVVGGSGHNFKTMPTMGQVVLE
ncbi:hypothetical protein K449DRAFT_470486 [Hypoxylon sp. EC38]|nr:hypothetical protein K449DRAFT_470486 [Hypoxylon sp. EC38]